MNSLAGGGMERAMLNLAKHYVDQGLSVDVLVASVKGPLMTEVPKSINLINLKSSKYKKVSIRIWLLKAMFRVEPRFLILFFIKKLPKAIKVIPALIDYLDDASPDVIFSTPTTANLSLIWAKTYCGYENKTIIREASNLTKEIQNKNTYFLRLARAFVQNWYNHADEVVCVSKGVYDDLHENYLIQKKKLNVIYNIIDVDMIEDKANSSEYDSLIEVFGDYILSAGRLEKQKDYEMLIRAFHVISDKSSVNLVIIGEGAERDKLEILIEELSLNNRVYLPGFFVNPYPFIKNCEVFALSSRWEGCPNVLREAMVLGKKIISTDCEGVSDILKGASSSVIPLHESYDFYANKLYDLAELKDGEIDINSASLIKHSKNLYNNLVLGEV